jgi:transketolase
MTGPDGATHQATEDIAITRAWPGIKIIVPCDSIEAEKATIAAGQTKGPMYLRFSRDKSPIMTTSQTPFALGKAQVFWISENPQTTIFATGYMLYYALLAAKALEEKGIHVLVVNMASIKPLDSDMLEKTAHQTGSFVTVEDHQVMGGLGGAIAEWAASHHPLPMEFVGLQDTFAESGKPAELIEKYHMGKDAIVKAVKHVLARK